MKVILQQDIKKIGKKGEIIEVSEGYGRNYLLPRKYAIEANAANVNVALAQANSAARKKQQQIDEAKLMAAQLSKIEVSIPVRIGEGGKLFGSVTGKDVATVLKQTHKIDIDKRKIEIKGEVKGVGTYDAVIKVHPEITSTIKVHVVVD
ncbi:MAG: 50S ribosomal protein L9 [Selenomonadaceae bacterium]